MHFPWIDRLLGTHHAPADRWPDDYGLETLRVPEGNLRQLVFPISGR